MLAWNLPSPSDRAISQLLLTRPSVEGNLGDFVRNHALLLFFATPALFAQSITLSVGSGSGSAGSAVSVPITLTTFNGALPTGLRWSFSYPSAITGVTVVAGTAATNAQKLISCAGNTCVVYGLTLAGISNGLVATATFQLSPSASGTIPISLTSLAAASAAASLIPATSGSGSIAVSVSPPPASLTSVGCATFSVATPGSTLCTVSLSAAAPVGGFQVSLSSNNANLSVPAGVTVAAGQNSATFSAVSGSVTQNQSATITGILNGVTQGFTLNLTTAVQLSSVSCSLTSFSASGTATCTIGLTGTASSLTNVTVSSNNANVVVPGAVTLSTGQSSATFTATIAAPGSNQTATLTVSLNGISRTATISLVVPSLSALVCSPSTLGSNQAATCTVLLNANVAIPAIVALASTRAALQIPASVTVPAGSSTAIFSAITTTITSNDQAAVTATLNGQARTTNLSLVASFQISSLTCAPISLTSNGSTVCTAVLTQPAVNGATIAVSSSLNALTVPSAVTIASGQTSVSFIATAGVITTASVANISVTLNGQNLSAQVQLNTAVQLSTISCSPSSVPSLGTVTCTVSLTSASLNPGVLAITANNSYLTAPTSVVVAAGKTSANFQVDANVVASPQTVILTAKLFNSTVSTSISVVPTVGLYNPATYQAGQACSPGAIATVIGSGFTNQSPQVATGPSWPLQLAGLQVNVNDQPVPLLYASDTLIHFQCPALAPGTGLRIVVRPDGAQPLDAILTIMQEATPGVYILDGSNQGAVLIAGTDLVAGADSTNRPSRPAKQGEYISIYADGLGTVDGVLPPGEPAPLDRLVRATAPVTVVIGDSELVLSPSFVGLTPGIVSLFVVNVQLTSDVQTGSSIPLYLKVTLSDGTVVSSNTVRIAVASANAP